MSEQTLPGQIAARLRRMILRGELPPDSHIKERDFASALGVSRTPLREAVRILANEGLIELRPSRSPVVADPGYSEIDDQVVVLLALERLAAELACHNASDEEIGRIATVHEAIAEAYDTLDPLVLFEMDMAFHAAIVAASHNYALAQTHSRFLERLWRARYLSASQKRNRVRVVNQHLGILKALQNRDTYAISEALDMHLGHLSGDIAMAMATERAGHAH